MSTTMSARRRSMTKLKVMSIFGTRPEAIKMAPLVLELGRREGLESSVCVTAQHREMLDSVLGVFGIRPEYDLNVMQSGQTLSDITARVLKGLEGVFAGARPDLVLVHGDTTTTFAAALAAFYAKTSCGHVEAGLRTYDRLSPYPEELNRQLVGRLATMHFAPTVVAMFTAERPTTLLTTRVPWLPSGTLRSAWSPRYCSVSWAMLACIFTASTGYLPAAVSPESITASVPS